MTDPTQDNDAEQRMLTLFREHLPNEDAVQFNAALCRVLHVVDDVIDRDAPLIDGDIVRAFRTALVVIPSNPFYARHAHELVPLIDLAFLSWASATHMERNCAEAAKRIAYVIRSDYLNVFLRSVQILRGHDYACMVAPSVRAMWHLEGWEGYLAALDHEAQQRSRHGPV